MIFKNIVAPLFCIFLIGTAFTAEDDNSQNKSSINNPGCNEIPNGLFNVDEYNRARVFFSGQNLMHFEINRINDWSTAPIETVVAISNELRTLNLDQGYIKDNITSSENYIKDWEATHNYSLPK